MGKAEVRRLAAPTACSILVLSCALLAGTDARGGGAPLVVVGGRGIAARLTQRVAKAARSKRSVLPLRPLPPRLRSAAQLVHEAQLVAITQALARARKHEEVADWDGCTKDAADELGPATEVLASSGRLDLLRALHLQIGACMSLAGQGANARTHFRVATLLDERAPGRGVHREEAEAVLEQTRVEVLGRSRGAVRIETTPSGGEVWIDGRKAPGRTPLSAHVRLGNHYITLRRFRFEPETNQVMLQPGGKLRFALGEAHRDTLRRQLGEAAGGVRRPNATELALARARWSGAGELLRLTRPPGPTRVLRLSLVDAVSGTTLRSRMLPPDTDEAQLSTIVCAALGERCEAPSRGVPWYVWPIAGAALVGAAVATGFIIDSQRETVFCPSGGCS